MVLQEEAALKLAHKTLVKEYSTQIDKILSMVSINAPEAEKDEERAPVDIVCVLDGSGSMQGKKLEMSIKTLQFITKELGKNDRLGVVSFSDFAIVEYPLTKLSNSKTRDDAIEKISRIQSLGSTNLCEGIEMGVKMLKTIPESEANAIRAVLVFTDGEANMGITDPRQMIDFVRDTVDSKNIYSIELPFEQPVQEPLKKNGVKKRGIFNSFFPSSPPVSVQQAQAQQAFPYSLQQSSSMQQVQQSPHFSLQQSSSMQQVQQISHFHPIYSSEKKEYAKVVGPDIPAEKKTIMTINTFGFGSDHDSNLLKNIAESFHGMYFFIENEKQIAESFISCVGGLTSSVASEIVLEIEALSEGKITKVRSGYEVTTIEEGKKYSIYFSDIRGEEQRDTIIEIDVPAISEENTDFPLVKGSLKYNNLIVDKKEEKQILGYAIRKNDPAKDQPVDSEVAENLERFTSSEVIEKAAQLGREGKYEEAKEKLSFAIGELSKKEYSAQCDYLLDNMKQLETDLSNSNEYESNGVHRWRNVADAQLMQRSSAVQSNVGKRFANKKQKSMFTKFA